MLLPGAGGAATKTYDPRMTVKYDESHLGITPGPHSPSTKLLERAPPTP